MILGLYSGEINNVLDNETKAALKEFQRLAGLSIDGILGPKTKAALEKGEDSYIAIGGADVNNVEVITYSKEVEDAQKTLKELNLYNGEIDGVSSRINAETRSILTRIKINNQDYELIPGSYISKATFS